VNGIGFVRDQAVVLEHEAERLDIVADNRHGNSPALKIGADSTDVSGSRSFGNSKNQTGRVWHAQAGGPWNRSMRASAVAARRPTFSVRPSVRTKPESLVMPLMN